MNNTKLLNRLTPIVLFGAISITLALVVTARFTGYKDSYELAGTLESSCQLRFEDMPSGVVNVYDLDDGRLLASFERGTGSFVRGILRSMTREHRTLEPASDTAFLLARYSDGALTIRDGTTGREIFLNDFGSTNANIFNQLLAASLAES